MLVDGGTPDSDDIVDDIEDAADDIEQLAAQLTEANAISETRHTEILEKIDSCLNKMESSSSMIQATTENPLLTQILSQLTETRVELATLKSSMDTMLNRPIQSVSPVLPEAETPGNLGNPDEPAADVSIDEPSEENLENPTPSPQRKNRFI